jgi:hypothetical protein
LRSASLEAKAKKREGDPGNTEDSLAAGRWGSQFDRTGNFKREYRTRNVECRSEKPFELLRFDILLFCGLPACGGFAVSAR